MMVPNPEYAGELIGIEFKEGEGEVKPRHPKRFAYKANVVANGRAEDAA
jgi:hypothetical protein